MKFILRKITTLFIFTCALALTSLAQNFEREFEISNGGTIEIVNRYGKVQVAAEEAKAEEIAEESDAENTAAKPLKVFLSAASAAESEVKIENSKGKIRLEITPSDLKKRIDLALKIPERTRVKIETAEGEALVSGNLELIEIQTETGTIAADVPLDNVKYDFLWTESRPRFLSDVELEKVSEKSAGKFVINGRIGEKRRRGEEEKRRKREKDNSEDDSTNNESLSDEAANDEQGAKDKEQRTKDKKRKSKPVSNEIKLNFTTARGIVLLNVPPNEVSSDLRERPLTNAAKAIIRSGDSLLTDAIRRASPKYFGDYSKTLPPAKREPVLAERKNTQNQPASELKKVLVRVFDTNNRAIAELGKEDFEITEAGEAREIVSVQPTTAPFNLVLLLDVSGSVDNYVNFIRKAARSFVNTVDKNDKVAIVIFNEDVQVISNFTTDKTKLSTSLDTFDAGGATALYDSLGYVLTETLRPMKGERTAIVALTDGDDNRSFLSFDSLLGSIQESGALVYPLYVPSSLIASSVNPNQTVDPLRARYTGLTTKAEGEGEKLAKISGGVYYPITQLDQIQKAYDDIVLQLRTAYSVTFRSNLPETADKSTASPRLKVKVKRENAFVKLGSVVAVEENKTSEVEKIDGINDASKEGGEPELNAEENMEITGEITGIEYKPNLTANLREINIQNFDINSAPPSFVLVDGQKKIAVSKWVSPKRTRSYPYERVYNTLSQPKRLTVIPILKDEGANGERDFVQFDTFSMMSLLEVFIVPAVYADAEKSAKEGKITNQKFDNAFILSKINEIENYHSSALHWNLKQLREISPLLERAKKSYAEISKKTGVKMHGEERIDDFAKKIAGNTEEFMRLSRIKAQSAQSREFVTIQPKESLSSDTKGRVTITDNLGGKYFFTCDETRIEEKTVYLIEAKHTSRAKIPAPSDIKDGLLKMILYTNLKNVRVGGKSYEYKPVLRLTSNLLKGDISSESKPEDFENFCKQNFLTVKQKEFLTKLFVEARTNKLTVKLESAAVALIEDLTNNLRIS